ncbi:MAG: Ldh family oxidoreductase [Rhodospirillales bacterium]|nr:Ldh family oxidoreductase [Rhodospirillales bacterium]
MSDTVLVAAKTVEGAIGEVLRRRGVPEADARAAACGLVGANLRGVDTHGLSCLPDYAKALDEKRLKATPAMTVERRLPWAATLDADNGLGPVAATRAMELALESADRLGVGAVAVRRSNHFGAAGVYAAMAAERGCVGIVTANASSVCAPFGAAVPLLGTNPLAVAVPAGRYPAFVLDMATSEGSRKKVRKALAEGKTIPSGWALGPDGRPTTDPQAALDGVMLPFGGVKGAGVTLLMDILSGVLTGAEFGGRVLSVMTNQERESGNGHFVLAFKVSAFMPDEEFRARMDEEIARLKALPPAAGFDEVMYPGEREWRIEAERSAKGIPLPRSLVKEVVALGGEGLPAEV